MEILHAPEVAIGRCQHVNTRFSRGRDDERVVDEEAVLPSQVRRAHECAQFEWGDIDTHQRDALDLLLIDAQSPNELGAGAQLLPDVTGGGESCRDGFNHHEAMGHLRQDDGRGGALDVAGFAALQQRPALIR